MTYKEIRDKFVEVTGRYDLINSDLTDNGADFFLNAAQRWLDRTHSHRKSEAKNVQAVIAGQVKVYITGLRAVKEVWWSSSDGSSMFPLTVESLGSIKEYYGKKLSTVTADVPEFYAPFSHRPYPDTTLTATWTGYQDIEDLILDDAHYTQNGIILMPPPTEAGYISIVGLFHSPTLSATLSGGVWTSTKSYWTENHPDTLISAATMKLHALYMNTTGATDAKGVVNDDLRGLDLDDAEYDTAGPSQMGG